jgi:hypothetical protein
LVEETIVTSAQAPSQVPSPPLGAHPAAAAPPQRSPNDAARNESRRRPDEPALAPATNRIEPSAHPRPEAASPVQYTISRSSRVIGRRMPAPPMVDTEIRSPDEAPLPADRDQRLLVMRRHSPAVGEPPLHPRVSPPAPAPAQAAMRQHERPHVQISIGRLEVRATVAAPAKTEREPPFRPRLTLQDHLARRFGES